MEIKNLPQVTDIETMLNLLKSLGSKIVISKKRAEMEVKLKETMMEMQNAVQQGKMLNENLEVTINFYNDKPINLDLPNQITCKIIKTDVALKGQTVSSSYKPATLENGINIQVPPFIESDDEIVIDTRTMEYVKKI